MTIFVNLCIYLYLLCSHCVMWPGACDTFWHRVRTTPSVLRGGLQRHNVLTTLSRRNTPQHSENNVFSPFLELIVNIMPVIRHSYAKVLCSHCVGWLHGYIKQGGPEHCGVRTKPYEAGHRLWTNMLGLFSGYVLTALNTLYLTTWQKVSHHRGLTPCFEFPWPACQGIRGVGDIFCQAAR